MSSQRFVFVLKIWQESAGPGAGGRYTLRGSLQPVGSEQVYYLSSFDQLLDLLRQLTKLERGSQDESDLNLILPE